MNIVLAGTPDFSIKVFEKIILNFNVVLIITQPDKPKGRGHQIKKPPIKILAEKYNIKVLQPIHIKSIYEYLESISFDLFITCAYGQYVPESILKLPKLASINIHASLLPQYRGAAPIHYSLLNGDNETGISIIYMTKKMDAGNIIFSKKIRILNIDDYNSLSNKLSNLAAENILNWIQKIKNNDINPIKQNESLVTLAPKISKDMAEILSNDTVEMAYDKYRAFIKYPISWIWFNNEVLKIYECTKETISNALEFKLIDGSIFITKFKLPNKNIITYKEYLNGKRK